MTAAVPIPVLCLVTRTTTTTGRGLVTTVREAVAGGVNMVQLREKDMPAADLYDVGVELACVVAGRALLFVNDRLDVALACGADGVQIGERGLPIRRAKELAGRRLLIGRSVHSAAGAEKAQEDGADLLVLGTVFPTASHPDGPYGGKELVREAADRVSIPIVAIGGVNACNAGVVMRAGASGVAVISAVMDSDEPQRAAARLGDAVDAGLTTMRAIQG